MQCLCNIQNHIDAIGVIVAAVIPVAIMFWTLYVEKKRHLKQIEQINEKNRIDAMPVIDLHPAQIIELVQNGDARTVVAMLSIVNTGNGTAVNVHVKDGYDVIRENIPKGGTVSLGTIRLHNDKDGRFRVKVKFHDLYGNEYSETIVMSLIKNDIFHELKREQISLPVIVRNNEAKE